MVYRNFSLAEHVAWVPDPNPEAPEIARRFLAAERDLLELEGKATPALAALQAFFIGAGEAPLAVWRGAIGEVMITAAGCDESLMLTGKTADILCRYLDGDLVTMVDRGEMTIRIHVTNETRRAEARREA